MFNKTKNSINQSERNLVINFKIQPALVVLPSDVVIIVVETIVVSVVNVVEFVDVSVVVNGVVGTSWHSKNSQGHPLRQLL